MGGKELSDLRLCPVCKNKAVQRQNIYQGARCLHCHRIVEVNVLYSSGVSLVLAAIVGLSFHYSYGTVGLCTTVILVIYSSGYKAITTRYFPLKSYKDSE